MWRLFNVTRADRKAFALLMLMLMLCQCLTEVECRRTTSTSRRGQTNRRNNYGGSSQGSNSGSTGFFSSFFGSKKSTATTGSSTTNKKSGSGWTSASQPSRTSSGQSGSWANPYYKPSAPPKQPATYGWVPAGKTHPTDQFHRSGQPSSNIGPGGYPVQTGYQPAGQFKPAMQSHGYNPQPQTYNTGHQSHGYYPSTSYNQPSHHAGGYPNVAPHGFASSHGISPGSYPSQSNFGYPGQGLFAGSQGPKYGGLNLFSGKSGSYGYGSNNWGIPSYGAKSSSGTGKLLTGLALGAAGGYLTSSLVNRVSSPWGYSGWGYGNRYGYDRPIIIKEIRETTKTAEPSEPEPDPKNAWISCVAFDPALNQTFINPNCSCTVTTTVNPETGLPISVHNCTTANGQLLPPVVPGMPPDAGLSLPPNAVNNPNAMPTYGVLYNENARYGAAPESVAPITEIPPLSSTSTSEQTVSSSSSTTTTTTEEAMMRDSPREIHYGSNPKVMEFYTRLEEITNMGKFNSL